MTTTIDDEMLTRMSHAPKSFPAWLLKDAIGELLDLRGASRCVISAWENGRMGELAGAITDLDAALTT